MQQIVYLLLISFLTQVVNAEEVVVEAQNPVNGQSIDNRQQKSICSMR